MQVKVRLLCSGYKWGKEQAAYGSASENCIILHATFGITTLCLVQPL